MSSPSPGWYPDPTSSGSLRFFDGESWTKSVVPVPTDGQLSPDMIAAGRKIMQAKAATKFTGAFVPNSLTDNQAQSLTSAVDTKAQRRTLEGAMDPTGPTEPSVESVNPALTSGNRLSQLSTPVAQATAVQHVNPLGLNSSLKQSSPLNAGDAETAQAKQAESANAHVDKPGKDDVPNPSSWTERVENSVSNSVPKTEQGGQGTSRWAPMRGSLQDPSVASTQDTSDVQNAGASIAGAKTSVAREEHTSAHSPATQTTNPIRRTGLSIPLPGRKDTAPVSEVSVDSSQPSWMSSGQSGEQDTSSFSATAGAQEPEKPGAAGILGRIKLSRGVWRLILLLVVVICAFVVIQLQSGGSQPADGVSEDYESLGLKQTFDCSALGAEVMTLSQSTPGEIPIDSLDNPKMSKDMRGSFVLPEKNGEFNDAFECEAVAVYSDGESETIKYNISADKNKKFWTKYDQRSQ